MVGPGNAEGEESFAVTLCTPGWLEVQASREGIVDCRHHVVVTDYDFGRMEQYFKRRVAACQGDTWTEVAAQVGRLGGLGSSRTTRCDVEPLIGCSSRTYADRGNRRTLCRRACQCTSSRSPGRPTFPFSQRLQLRLAACVYDSSRRLVPRRASDVRPDHPAFRPEDRRRAGQRCRRRSKPGRTGPIEPVFEDRRRSWASAVGRRRRFRTSTTVASRFQPSTRRTASCDSVRQSDDGQISRHRERHRPGHPRRGQWLQVRPGQRGSAVTAVQAIYVKLIDEVVDVWRPVEAEHLHGDVFRISEQPYDRNAEAWEFEPGDAVVAEVVQSNDGPILAAARVGLEP